MVLLPLICYLERCVFTHYGRKPSVNRWFFTCCIRFSIWLDLDRHILGSTQSGSFAAALSVSLESLVQSFWQIEEPEEAPTMFTCDEHCESIYVSERTWDHLCRFLVPLPFIPKHRDESFPESRNIAESRFQNFERKLQNDSALYTTYKNFMNEYETLSHMSLATEPGIYFIPHHPVLKPNCPPNKTRVVFDTSAKSASQLSLN